MTPDARTADVAAACDVIRAAIVRTGWSETARRSGVDRTNLHRTFRVGATRLPSFTTVALVADALDLRISITPKGEADGQ